MNCNRNLKDCHYKTSEAAYNPNAQALSASGVLLTLVAFVYACTL